MRMRCALQKDVGEGGVCHQGRRHLRCQNRSTIVSACSGALTGFAWLSISLVLKGVYEPGYTVWYFEAIREVSSGSLAIRREKATTT
jgi:hypothetical protein